MDISGNNANVDPPDGDTGDLDEAVTYALTDTDSEGPWIASEDVLEREA